jgi:hypothetical protein
MNLRSQGASGRFREISPLPSQRVRENRRRLVCERHAFGIRPRRPSSVPVAGQGVQSACPVIPAPSAAADRDPAVSQAMLAEGEARGVHRKAEGEHG